MVFKKNIKEKFLSPEALEERLRKSDLSEEEKKLSREVIKLAKQHNIGLAEAEIDVGKRNFLKGMGILGGALLVMGKVPKVFADEMVEKFNLDLGSTVLKQRPSELYYWSQIWKSNYINEFGVQIGLEFRKEEITKDSSEVAITQAVRNAATIMENLLNAFTCWGQNTPWQTTRGVCGDAGFCQTFAQLHAPAGQYFCSPNTRMVGWDIRVLNAKFLPNGDLKLRMNVLIVDKQYFDTSERVDAPWILEKFAPPMYIKILNLKKVLGSGKPWPSPNYYTFQSGPNKGKEYKDGSPFEAADFLGERVPPYTKLDKATWVKDLTLKVLRGGGTDSGELTLDPMTPYPFQQLGDTRGLALLNKINAMQNEGWRKYLPTKGDYHVFIDEYRATYAELWKHIHALGNAYYKYIEPSFYHLVWFTYGVKNYGGEVILNVNIKSGCQPSDSPIPGANCETGCLLAGALTASYPCQNYTPPPGNTCPASGFNVTANVDCTTPIKVTLSILNCYQNNTPVKDTTIYYKYGYGANWNYGSFNTGTTGTGDITVLEEYTNKGEFWLYLYTDSDQTGEIFSTFSSSCACDEICCSDADCPSGQVCINGECQTPSNTANPTISNPEWDTNNFCTKGFTVKGRLTQGGAGTRGIVNVAVNNNKVACTLVDSNNYNFSIPVLLSKYKKYLAKTGENTISVTGTLCASGDCSGSCLGPITNPQITTIPDCACDYSLDISKYAVTPNTVTIGNSVVVSGSISLTKGQNCFLNGQDIDIYNNESKVATAITTAKGNFSTSITLKTIGIHKIEAKLGNSNVSKKVTVTEAPVPVTVGIEYLYGVFEQKFQITVAIPNGKTIKKLYDKSIKLVYGTKIATATYFTAEINLNVIPGTVEPCTWPWVLDENIKNKLISPLEAIKKFSGPQIDEIINQVQTAGIEVLKAVLDNPPNALGIGIIKTQGCENTATTNRGYLTSTYTKITTFEV